MYCIRSSFCTLNTAPRSNDKIPKVPFRLQYDLNSPSSTKPPLSSSISMYKSLYLELRGDFWTKLGRRRFDDGPDERFGRTFVRGARLRTDNTKCTQLFLDFSCSYSGNYRFTQIRTVYAPLHNNVGVVAYEQIDHKSTHTLAIVCLMSRFYDRESPWWIRGWGFGWHGGVVTGGGGGVDNCESASKKYVLTTH